MVSLFLGNGPDTVYKIESLLEIRELEGTRQVMLIDYIPVRQLVGEVVKLSSLERRDVAPAGNASLAG
jgi:hypothetical protein